MTIKIHFVKPHPHRDAIRDVKIAPRVGELVSFVDQGADVPGLFRVTSVEHHVADEPSGGLDATVRLDEIEDPDAWWAQIEEAGRKLKG